MHPPALATELISCESHQPLGQIYLATPPQPGHWFEFEGTVYIVLERRHRYQLRANRYQLHKITLILKPAPRLDEVSQVGHRTVIGNASCRYNAQSQLVRCAVNPLGPCQGCQHFQPR
ncbi:MAG TPA: hypothetical protein IGR64_18190 [Leptolyngbyaceae cyanobacterium M65_K2018_010]|nr:hypothetical protein [Leptolyngbyaceae cyanobacterium M65_K2018_010]